MVNTILKRYQEILRDQVIRSVVDNSNGIDVKFVKPYAKGDELHMNAINIVLFGSTAEKDLLGTSTFGTPNSENKAINQKPSLRLTLDTLLIFNFRRYETALDCYGQVLGYFYNNDVFKVFSDGYENQVEILLSSFRDLNEIEIWNSFNMPGLMLLRYELKYALITGRFDELPVIRKYSSSIGQPDSAGVSNLIMNMVYQPVGAIYNDTVLFTTNNFCSITLDTEDVQAILDERYTKLVDSYTLAFDAIELFKVRLESDISNGELEAAIFQPFIPSIDGILLLNENFQTRISSVGPPTPGNFNAICLLAKEQIYPPIGLINLFLYKLKETSDYLRIEEKINEGIAAFNVVGYSAYVPITGPNAEFIERPELSVLQIRQKWWEIESEMTQLLEKYQNEIDSRLLAREGEVYLEFKDLLVACQTQIIEPYELFSGLNIKFNKGSVHNLPASVRAAFTAAFTSCFNAINYIDNQDVTVALSDGLQNIFIQQNK